MAKKNVAAPTRQEKSASQKKAYRIPLRQIIANTNPRNPLSLSLQSQGWDCLKGEKQIWKLAVSKSLEDRALFVQLIQEFDGELAALAATINALGLQSPVEVRDSGTDAFTLAYGARRCLATLYLWCVTGKPAEPWIDAFLVKGNTTAMLSRGIVENIRKPQSVIEEARAIEMMIHGGESKDEVARQLGVSLGTIDGRLKLLEMSPAIQRKIHEGLVKVREAKEEHAAENGKPVAPAKPPLRKRKEIEEAIEEFNPESPERNALEWMLGLREKIK